MVVVSADDMTPDTYPHGARETTTAELSDTPYTPSAESAPTTRCDCAIAEHFYAPRRRSSAPPARGGAVVAAVGAGPDGDGALPEAGHHVVASFSRANAAGDDDLRRVVRAVEDAEALEERRSARTGTSSTARRGPRPRPRGVPRARTTSTRTAPAPRQRWTRGSATASSAAAKAGAAEKAGDAAGAARGGPRRLLAASPRAAPGPLRRGHPARRGRRPAPGPRTSSRRCGGSRAGRRSASSSRRRPPRRRRPWAASPFDPRRRRSP